MRIITTRCMVFKMNVFDTGLNEFCRRFLVKNSGLPTPSPLEFLIKMRLANASIFENLLLFDTVSYKVCGENIPLVILINNFGVKGIEALIEQGAINFVLWNQMVTYFVDDIAGVDPLQSGYHSSSVYSDPEESIRSGFNWMKAKLNSSEKKMLVRKIREIYTIPSNDLSKSAVSLARSSYESGKLLAYNLSPETTSFRDLNIDERKKLCSCATEILQYSHLINNNMTSFDNFEFYKMFDDSVNKINMAAKIQSDFNSVCNLENIPDLKNFFPEVDNPFAKVVKLRNSSSSKKFRKWLSDCSNSSDGIDITKNYLEAIENTKGFFETKTGRFTKNIAMSAFGTGLGLVVSNYATPTVATLAGGVGLAASKLLEPAASLGLDMLDEFVLAGVLKGWTPKLFFRDIEKIKLK